MPNIAAKSSATIRLAARSAGILKTSSGISGSAASLPSTSGEEAEQDDPERQRHQHAERAPAERVGADDAVDDRGQPAADQHRAGDVEPALARRTAATLGITRRPASTTAIPTGTLMMKTRAS